MLLKTSLPSFLRSRLFTHHTFKRHIARMSTLTPEQFQKEGLPLCLKGEVVRGFGRGSKDLGIPTANFPEFVVEDIPEQLNAGVYFGWAKLSGYEQTFPMVMSIGWNPFYNNTKKTAETHIMHKFDQDFYGHELRVLCNGHIRNEKNFSSLQALIDAINDDMRIAKEALALPLFQQHKEHAFLTE
eukprot:comp21653_c2_seq1/m.30440 comp21653_c2_seq1/g.30440  ORF comp21653_c2_seq1/g.30440 comp21653_c2_seq1/m.30440 type:complete len:185 (-) comp21653_c2_seq1:211-765(-)